MTPAGAIRMRSNASLKPRLPCTQTCLPSYAADIRPATGCGSSFRRLRASAAVRWRSATRAYLDHPVLGTRLRECCEILLGIDGRNAEEIFGYPDVLKLRSSLTLFARASRQGDSVFDTLLAKYYDGKPDPQTLALID